MDKETAPNLNIPQYRVLSKIGAGGMGEVYRARDERLERDVAIKVLPAEFSSDEDRMRRFEVEARSAGSLNHPNILVIYQVGTDDVGSPYIVSELLEGETLRERMAGGAVPQRKALDYALQIAQGLAAAHEKGIIHRDLKPENIFVTTDGRIKILDFGLAKLTQPQEGSVATDIPTRKHQTEPGTIMGTIAYMSPEQVRAHPLDQRTDIFSFGVIFYEMLTGRMAFQGDSTADLMSAILREEPPRLSASNATVSPAIERVIEHCLEKSPDERFRSASDLAFAIEALSSTTSSNSTPAVDASAVYHITRRTSVLVPWVFVGILVAVSGILAYLLWSRPPLDQRQTRFAIAPPENVVEMTEPAVSADGGSIAFVANFDGKRHIYVRRLNNPEAQRLAGTENGSTPFWSPDGRNIGFFADGKLKRISVDGGPIQTICDARLGSGGTWNTEGVIAFSMFDHGLHRVSETGGQPKLILEIDKENREIDQNFPSFLPDGNHFVYLSWRGSPQLSQVWVAALDGSDRKHVIDANSNANYAEGYLLFAQGAALMAQSFDLKTLTLSGSALPVAENVSFEASKSYSNFSVSQGGIVTWRAGGGVQRQLAWFDRTGKLLSALDPPGMYNDLALSPDGKWVATQRLEGERSDIWVFDTARNLASRFTLGNNNEDDPVWSTDSRYLYFTASGDGGMRRIRRKPTLGGAEEAVADAGDRVLGEGIDVSPDGKLCLVVRAGENSTDLWLVPLDGGEPSPFLNSPFNENRGKFSPDGRWVAYMSSESGRAEVYVRSFPEDTVKLQVSNQGGDQPRWNHDGTELFYIDSDRQLIAVKVKRNAATIGFDAPVVLFRTQIAGTSFPNRYDISADGQRFLVNSSTDINDDSPLHVVTNWTSGLQ